HCPISPHRQGRWFPRISPLPPLSSVPRNCRIRALAPGSMRVFWSLILCLMLAPGAVGAATLGDAQIGFTADRTLVIDGRTYLGKIWTMPGRERHEQAIQAFRPVFLL